MKSKEIFELALSQCGNNDRLRKVILDAKNKINSKGEIN